MAKLNSDEDELPNVEIISYASQNNTYAPTVNFYQRPFSSNFSKGERRDLGALFPTTGSKTSKTSAKVLPEDQPRFMSYNKGELHIQV